jgi:hypothetical protein
MMLTLNILALSVGAIEEACAELRSAGADDGHDVRAVMTLKVLAAVGGGERSQEALKQIARAAGDRRRSDSPHYTAPPDSRQAREATSRCRRASDPRRSH